MGQIFHEFLVWAVEFAPKPMRIGCTVLLGTIGVALLMLVLWPRG